MTGSISPIAFVFLLAILAAGWAATGLSKGPAVHDAPLARVNDPVWSDVDVEPLPQFVDASKRGWS